MKKIFPLLLLCSVVALASCKKTDNPDNTVAVSEVKLNKTSLSLAVENKETLIATVTPDDASNKSVTWSSSNTSVATVSESGEVVAIADGDAVITATSAADKTKTATCQVKVSSTLSVFINNVTNAPSLDVINSIKVEVDDAESGVATFYAEGTWNGSEGTLTFFEGKNPKLLTIQDAFGGKETDISTLVISNTNANISKATRLIGGYKDKQFKGAFIMMIGEQMCVPIFVYASEKVDITGSYTEGSNKVNADMKLKKGWNSIYSITTKEKEGYFTTTLPSNTKWEFISED